MENLLGILFLATFVEGFITYVAGEVEKARQYLKYVALAIGVIVCVVYKVDIPAMLGLATPIPYASYILSGVIVGRGSNYVNDLMSSFKR